MTIDDDRMAHLARLAQRGDRAAYGTLLQAARHWLLRYFRRRVPPERIDDLVQDTLLSVHAKLASYDPDRPFMPWLAVIARFRFVDQLRSSYRMPTYELDPDLPDGGEENAMVARLSLERMFAALPTAQQRAIELVKITGCSISEAARVTGQSEALVKVNIHRGLKRLATLIEST